MNFKNAIAVCLISMFSATLVLLIARALDLQAATRLEPQLARIVEELQAIRKSGGISSAIGSGADRPSVNECLMVYYFHGKTRCPTCRAIESQSYETVHTDFAAETESGKVVWKVLNYEEPTGADLAERFQVQMATVVLARMTSGQIQQWNRLDRVWALWNDKPAFASYVRDEINRMLETTGDQAPAEIQEPAEDSIASAGPLDIPVPQVNDEQAKDEADSGAVSSEVVPREVLADDGLIVHYFHATERCPTCRTIESQSRAAVYSEFASQLASGEIVWQPLNYEEPTGAPLAAQFGVQWPVVVLAKVRGGQIEAWKSLDQVWTLVDDKPAFTDYVRREIAQMLEARDEKPTAMLNGDAVEDTGPSDAPADRPDPTAPAGIPVP